METIDKIKDALKLTIDINKKRDKAENLYWLYRLAKDNPRELEIAFLIEANKLQKSAIDDLDCQIEELSSEKD